MALIKGTASNNALFGTAGGDFINGLDGDDTLYSNGGADIMSGGNGNDTFYFGFGSSFGFGGAGDDTFYSGATGNTINGGAGMDTLFYGSTPVGMTIDMELGIATRNGAGNTVETFTLIERIAGSAFKDSISGSSKQDWIKGGAGDDKLLGLANADTLYGNDGNDWIDGGVQSDTISGGNGNDILIGGEHADTIYGGDGNDTIILGTLFGPADSSGNTGWGGIGNDNIQGGASTDTLQGGTGIDWLDGGDGVNHVWFGKDQPKPGSSLFPGTMDGDRDTLLFDCKGTKKIDYVHEFGYTDGDRIILDNTSFKSFADISKSMIEKDGNIYINAGPGATLVLMNCQKMSLNADDFILS